jgi:hypothetical protein
MSGLKSDELAVDSKKEWLLSNTQVGMRGELRCRSRGVKID